MTTSYTLLAALVIAACGGMMILLARSLVQGYHIDGLALSLPFG